MTTIKILLLSAIALTGLTPISDFHSSSTLAKEATISSQVFYKYIRCHRQAKNIVINWGTTSITGVDHFVIYHSEIGDFFDPIGEVDPDGTLKYTFKHESVFPGYHYYYVAAVMNGGSPVNSPVDVVRIVGH